MSGLGQERAEVQLKDIARPSVPYQGRNSETYFGSKLIQALAEYSGNFRHEFPHVNENAHVGTNESNSK